MCSSLLKVIDNLATLVDGVSTLPPNLKARILYLMQKRGLVSDENIAKVCKLEMSWFKTLELWPKTFSNLFCQYYLCCNAVWCIIQSVLHTVHCASMVISMDWGSICVICIICVDCIINYPHRQQLQGYCFFNPSLSVCLSVFMHHISKTDVARIAKLDTEMFHNGSWKPIYFRVKRSKVMSHRNIAGMVPYTLVSAGLF